MLIWKSYYKISTRIWHISLSYTYKLISFFFWGSVSSIYAFVSDDNVNLRWVCFQYLLGKYLLLSVCESDLFSHNSYDLRVRCISETGKSKNDSSVHEFCFQETSLLFPPWVPEEATGLQCSKLFYNQYFLRTEQQEIHILLRDILADHPQAQQLLLLLDYVQLH